VIHTDMIMLIFKPTFAIVWYTFDAVLYIIIWLYCRESVFFVKMYVDRISSMDIPCGTVGHLLSWLRSTAEHEDI